MGDTSPTGSDPPPLRYDNPPLHRIGWHRESLVSLAVVLLGYLIGLVGATFVVPPGAASAPNGRILLAFSITVVGVLIALVAAMLAYRRRHNWSWLVIGSVPAIALLLGGAVLAATKAGGA
jgi:uncharacterized BrkB/YihY/UPF0761 family membrane protein